MGADDSMALILRGVKEVSPINQIKPTDGHSDNLMLSPPGILGSC